jgi:hypothetical protein
MTGQPSLRDQNEDYIARPSGLAQLVELIKRCIFDGGRRLHESAKSKCGFLDVLHPRAPESNRTSKLLHFADRTSEHSLPSRPESAIAERVPQTDTIHNLVKEDANVR